MLDNKNLILAVAFSVAILVGFEFYTEWRHPPQEPVPGQQAQQGPQAITPAPAIPSGQPQAGQSQGSQSQGGQSQSGASPSAPQAQGTPGAPSAAPAIPNGAREDPHANRAAVLAASGPRITIHSPRLAGSIALTGGRINDLTLVDYHEELDPSSARITLLSPQGTAGAYFAEYGWVATAGVTVPGPQTLWTADRDSLTPATPVSLRWDNGQGQRFIRTFALDENYMLTVSQRVDNSAAAPVTVYPYGLLSRHETPEVTGYFILHEGLIGVVDGTLKEIDYDELQEDPLIEQPTTGGWVGITDKYWLAALIPDQKEPTQTRFTFRRDNGTEIYQVDYLGMPRTIAAGGSAEVVSHFFAGAKEAKLLDAYQEKLGIARFDLAIDFGWFYFLTKPIFYALVYINEHIGNFGISILLLTVAIKLLFFPLANKSYTAMSKMKKLQPEMVSLRERFSDDKARLNQEMMALYKKEGANPASGCLPMIVQIPVFFSLYKVLFVTIEMRQAPFYGWIHDLSAPDPTTIFNLFGLIPWNPDIIPAVAQIGVWPLIMGITMWLQQRLNPQPADPLQAKIFMFLPIMFTFLLARFPAGLVIYWAWNNLLSIIQQKVIMMRMGVK